MATIRRTLALARVNLALNKDDLPEGMEVVADTFLQLAESFVQAELHIGAEASLHLHEAIEIRQRLSERLPTNVLASRSRRPGRHT